jgi:hypothetical protein
VLGAIAPGGDGFGDSGAKDQFFGLKSQVFGLVDGYVEVIAAIDATGQRSTFAMYKMEINVSGQQRIFLFRGPGCRKAMLEWWRDHLHRAEAGEDIRSIRVLGTVASKTDIVLEWP